MSQGRDAAYATACNVMVDNLALRDGQEGIRAFIEKRKPVWSHKAEKAHDWWTALITGNHASVLVIMLIGTWFSFTVVEYLAPVLSQCWQDNC